MRTCGRQPPSHRPVPSGPLASDMAVGHRLAAPSPPRAAAGALRRPNGANLALRPDRGVNTPIDTRAKPAHGRRIGRRCRPTHPTHPTHAGGQGGPVGGGRHARVPAVGGRWRLQRPAATHNSASATCLGDVTVAAAHAAGTQKSGTSVVGGLGERLAQRHSGSAGGIGLARPRSRRYSTRAGPGWRMSAPRGGRCGWRRRARRRWQRERQRGRRSRASSRWRWRPSRAARPRL